MTHTGKGRILLIAQTVLCIVIAALLIAGAVDLYLDGSARRAENPLESIYTAEGAAQKARVIAVPGILFLCVLAVSFITGLKSPDAHAPAKGIQPPETGPEEKKVRMIRTVIVAAAAAFILAGILNGSALDVLVKAINICTECIGLG